MAKSVGATSLPGTFSLLCVSFFAGAAVSSFFPPQFGASYDTQDLKARLSALQASTKDTSERFTHVTLSGGRIFPCADMLITACLRAALAASIEEAASLRTVAGKFSCLDVQKVMASGAYCVSTSVSSVGGNNFLDEGLAAAFCKEAGEGSSLLDLGAGLGHYRTSYTDCGLQWRGFDGSANIEEVTNGHVKWADLSVPIDLGISDWVQSLEVGEHLPERYTSTFLDNLVRHAKHGILLSWALPNQGGHNHVNERNNSYVILSMEQRAFRFDAEATFRARGEATIGWLKNTAMIFVRK